MEKLEIEIRNLVFETIPIEFDLAKVNSDTTLKSLGLTSLEILDVIFELEDKYDIDIDTEEMFQMESLSQLAKLIGGKMIE